MVLVNLGCGPDGIEGWQNYDWGWMPLVSKLNSIKRLLVRLGLINKNYLVKWPNFKLADIRKKLPIETESVDWVYCSNVIEHLEKWEAKNLLEEIKRILKRNGKMRIVLPDLNKIIENYGDKPEEFNRVFYGFDKDAETKGIIGRLVRSSIRPHQWMYTPKSFEKLAKESGFKKIEIKKYRESQMPDVEKLDLAIHQELGFYLEAKTNNVG